MLSPPTLTGYLKFLYQVVGVKPINLPSTSGTATDGSPVLLIDVTQNWNDNQWNGYYCQDLSIETPALIVDTLSNALSFGTPLDQPVVAGDLYLVVSEVVLSTLAISTSTVAEAFVSGAPDLYTRAIYNLATHFMITDAPDQLGQTWWQDKRALFRITDPILGIVSSTSNDSSSMSYLNPEQFKTLTIGDLELMKTPYGRRYLADAQAYGFEPWGIT